GSQSTTQFAGQVRAVREALDELGRDVATFPIAKRVYLAVDEDSGRAQERLAYTLGRIYGPRAPDLTPVTVLGPPDACAEGLREVAGAGAEMILLNPIFDEAEQMERPHAEGLP